MSSYITISKPVKVELTQKKSLFIGLAQPIEDALAAGVFLEQVRKAYPDARHHVYAWRTRSPQQMSRFSDDGEPSGTGGAMVLDVLDKQKIQNAIIVVVRYFGGILLGAGPLARMYSNAASQAVQQAEPVLMKEAQMRLVEMDYSTFERVRSQLRPYNVTCSQIEYGETVKFCLSFFAEEEKAICECLRNELKAEVSWQKMAPEFKPMPLEFKIT